MSTVDVVDIFFPRHFTSRSFSDNYLLGSCKLIGKHVIISCLFVAMDEHKCKTLLNALNIECSAVGFIQSKLNYKDLMCHSGDFSYCDFMFGLVINFKTLHIEIINANFRGSNINHECIRLIHYDSDDLIKAQLLLTLKKDIVEFVADSIIAVKNSSAFTDSDNVFFPIKVAANKSLLHLHLLKVIFNLIMLVRVFCDYLFSWPKWLKNICLRAAVGRQFHQKLMHLKFITNEMKTEKSFSLCAQNTVSVIILDLVIGWFMVYLFQNYVSPRFLLLEVMAATNEMVNSLQSLIYWLMGVPAGLKLNIPLNSVLGHFFLYHIYLWKSYIDVIQPVFEAMLGILLYIGLLGGTFVFCLIYDIISLAAIHIYCFYGYAARIYYYQLQCLTLLWRLFRGKKWNAELQKVESYTYDVHVLYIGTFIFTVLLFLLPTVMVYYFVFTLLRIIVLMTLGLISKAVHVLTVIPVYTIILRIFYSKLIAGDISFTVLKREKTISLYLEVVQIPLSSVIKYTVPVLIQYEDSISWKTFFSSLIWGKLVYPL